MMDKRTAVVVDDEPITRMDVVEMLRTLGFAVVGEALDGFDAVELCRVHRPNIVLMDARMPVFDGLTASRTILEKCYCHCVVLLTAYQDRDMIQKAAAGVSGYLVKPIDQIRFQPAIEVALAQSQRLCQSEARTRQAMQKVEENKRIFQAQKILAQANGCSQMQSYQMLRKLAMDKRMTIAAVAEQVLRRFGTQEETQ